MRVSERVVRYIHNEMTDSEREAFEAELKNSASMQEELNYYREFLISLKGSGELKVDEDYFNSIIPRFRVKQSSLKRKYLPQFAVAGGVIAVLIVVLFYFNKTEVIQNVQDIASFTSEEIDSLAIYYPEYLTGIDTAIINNDDTYSSIVDDMFTEELGISESMLDSIFSENSYYSYYNYNFNNITEEEAQIVYNELIDRRLF